MGNRMRIRAGDVELECELADTTTAETLWMLMPVSGRATRWGDEFYFRVPEMMADPEPDARDVLEIGDVGYWVEGQAIAIFFGPTPASRDDEPRAAAPVNVIGSITGDATAFRRLDDSTTFHLERVD